MLRYELSLTLTGDEMQALSYAIDAQHDLLDSLDTDGAELAALDAAAAKLDAAAEAGRRDQP